MSTRSSHCRAILAAAILAGCLWADAVAAGGLYKWVDQDGHTHYSEFAPPGQSAEQLKPPPPVDTGAAVDALKAQQEALQKQNEAADKAAQEAAKKKAEMAQKKQRCDAAHRELDRLQNAQRIYTTDKDNNRVRLGEDERQARIKSTEKVIQQSCQ